MSRAWSIRTRAGYEFAASVTLYLVVVGLLMSSAYRAIIASELDEELLEQVAAHRGRLPEEFDGLEELASAVAFTAVADQETPMVWRFRRAAGGGTQSSQGGPGVRTVGPWTLRDRLEEVPRGASELEVWRPDSRTRQVFLTLADGIEADVLLDGGDWMDRTWLFSLSFAAVALLGSLLSLLAGSLFGRRVATMVAGVAEEVSSGSSSHELLSARAQGAPVEVRAVAEAIEARLAANRREIERSQILTAGLAHDLRAPLQALLTSTQVSLLAGVGSHVDLRETLGRHLGELRGLVRTVDNIMEWGAPRPSEQEAGFVAFDLGASLCDRLVGEEEAAAKAGVFMDRTEFGDLAYFGDPTSIVLAVRNLVGNAIDWCPSGGEVSVEVRGTDLGITISVRDDGPGVSEFDQHRIFEPFVRGAAAPGKRAGYGLGLSIVRAVAERHGGSVEVEAGEGGRFQLSLPHGGPRSAPRL